VTANGGRNDSNRCNDKESQLTAQGEGAELTMHQVDTPPALGMESGSKLQGTTAKKARPDSVITKSIRLILTWQLRTNELPLVNHLKTDPAPLESSDRLREPR
jgi:hypothetical protein